MLFERKELVTTSGKCGCIEMQPVCRGDGVCQQAVVVVSPLVVEEAVRAAGLAVRIVGRTTTVLVLRAAPMAERRAAAAPHVVAPIGVLLNQRAAPKAGRPIVATGKLTHGAHIGAILGGLAARPASVPRPTAPHASRCLA